MKRFMLTFVLAIAAGVWMTNEATGRWCMPSIRTETEPWIELTGVFQAEGFPCQPNKPCPPCLTIALATSEKLYYLVTDDGQLIERLDTIKLGTIATVSGIPFTYEGDDYIQVKSIDTTPMSLRLKSLCDEWNVLEISNVTCGYCEEYKTYNFHLTTDTVISGLLYSQLIKDGAYKGALREGNNRDIYCVPAGCSQEYLLYAFNAQVGDSLKNIWVGGHSSWIPDVRSVIVSEIKQTTPRTIVLEVHYYEAPDAYEESIRNLTWTEGIGMPFGPMGAECSIFNGCADSRAKLLLCAYKNGEQVYVSELGEKYGCDYNYDPLATHTDTIPLFIKDGPGSSTVEPVDPNLIYATLTKDVLSVYAKEKTEISFVLYKAPKTNQVPATKHTMKSASFTGSLSTTLTESGTYTMELTSPAWGYTVFGTFEYKVPQAVENTSANAPSATKILRDGQLLLMYQEQMFNVQGQRIK